MRSIAIMLSGVIAVGMLLGTGWWLAQTEPVVVVAIDAAYDVPENGLPIYAQFVATQTLSFDTEILATHLRVPIYRSTEGQVPLTIAVRMDQRTVARWRYADVELAKARMTDLPFAYPTPLRGTVEVSFSASQIAVADKATAPRIFIETADENYAEGNYRIAANEKQGDIGMHVVAQKTRGELLLALWRDKPIRGLQRVFVYVLLFLLFTILPLSISSAFLTKNRTPEATTIQTAAVQVNRARGAHSVGHGKVT